MNTLVLVRHGETEWNSDNRVQGSVDVPLSEEGTRQARALAAFLREKGFAFDRAYTSDLDRSRTTGQVIADALAIPALVASPLLRELNCGAWEGRSIPELRERETEAYRRWRHESDFAVPGGESMLDLRARVEAFFSEQAAALESSENVLIVAHGLLNRMVLSVVMGLDPQQSRYFAQDNAAMSVFRWVRGRVHCVAWNVACHL
jgi:broad specificity phosphatase PhoE